MMNRQDASTDQPSASPVPDILQVDQAIQAFQAAEHVYSAAIREVQTKLEILSDEFSLSADHNPIHHIVTRVKAPTSIAAKLQRRGFDLSVRSARRHLSDIAGVRVICQYIDDIYMIADLLLAQDDIHLIRQTDYIKRPKPNGYRSLHLIISVPVYLARRKEQVKVEIQIRTIAMDFWASLQHDLAYKLPNEVSTNIFAELRDCADVIADTDRRMQKLNNLIASQTQAACPRDEFS